MLKDRLALISAIFTVLIMFAALVWLQPNLVASTNASKAISGIASALLSFGVYSVTYRMSFWIFSKSIFIRQVILGETYLEGTWVGYYEVNGEPRFTVEVIRQHSGETLISGREFDTNGRTRASWTSDTVSIDERRMRLVYAYTCELFHEKHVQQGLGAFSIIVEKPGGPPTKLDGYSVDLTDGERNPNTEIKISRTEMADSDALAVARKRFSAPDI